MADLKIDLDAISARQLKEMMTAVSDADATAAVVAVGTQAVLERIFREMAERFREGSASGVDANVQFKIDDGADTHYHAVKIAGGSCTTVAERLEERAVTLTMSLAVFLRLITGVLDGPSAFMSGQLKVAGDIMFASRVMNFFDRP